MGTPWIETRPLRSRRTPSASGRAPSVRGPVPHTGPRPAPCPKGTPSEIENQLENKSQEDFANTIVRVISDETNGEVTDEKFLKDKFAKSFKYILKKEKNKIQHNQVDTSNLLGIQGYAEKYFEGHARQKELLKMVDMFKTVDEEKNIL